MIKLSKIYIIFICTSCTFFVRPKDTYILKNDTNKDIEISFYNKSKLERKLQIKSKTQFDSTFLSQRGSVSSPFPLEIDSVVIKFTINKYIRQYCNGIKLCCQVANCKIEKNLLNFEDATIENNRRIDKITKIIAFDESDYQRAKPL